MAWVHDSGYEPAYAHEGHPVPIQIDGTEAAASSAPTPLEVLGWRSACECGWRGMQFYPRSEWPSATALAPDGVDGWETGTATFAEWRHHVDRALPELAVHDLARQLADVEERLERACHAARHSGLTWAQITRAATGHPAVHAARHGEITGRTGACLAIGSTPGRA
ncbi:hypothetical protein [Pseudonocardia sp. GCM10023141]|uniref:hypothetical protein n=1 Tax=Pseudonocardia sp. GCM10023141 TaxID=3252653 RepID=UPI00361CC2BE